VPYKAFKTSDGDILLGGGNDRLYGVLCTSIGKPEWVTDERFNTNAQRVKNRDTLEDLIEHETRKKTTQEWLEVLEGCGMRKNEFHILFNIFTNENSLRCY
jgi:succinate--hydroxymethylglutarate CoA-transferase